MDSATPQTAKATRSSLACLPCRSRHLKCDGRQPRCSRCAEAARPCLYTRSRRGGLDRAALAERRRRLAGASSDSSSPGQNIDASGFGLDQSGTDTLFSGDATDKIGLSDAIVSITSSSPPTHPDIDGDPLVDLYYQNFHRFHPLVLPRRHLARLCRDPSRRPSWQPVVAVLRLIGQLYGSRAWSVPLQDAVDGCLARAPAGPAVVQSRLLYSTALFWSSHKAAAQWEMEAAVRLALDLNMADHQFADEHSGGDPVLAECWRRTWWMLYVVEAFYAGTLGTMNFATMAVEATAGLPCEEDEYEGGTIPPPKTIHDFDCREFSDDTSFSSFAYLVGAVRCVASAMALAPKIATRDASEQVIQEADSVIDGWLLLLPEGRKPVMSKTGEIDELMFQAHLVIHVSSIGTHRPLSGLKFNPVEDVSSCAREPPADSPRPALVNVHTVRVLRSVEAQIRLLALPARPFHHSPFTTCMVSEGALALLSACAYLLAGRELAVARDQIRLTFGCLRALGEVWARTAKNVREIQTIARHVLQLERSSAAQTSLTPGSDEVPSLVGGGSETETGASDNMLADVDMDNLCGWYSFDDMSWLGTT